MLLIKKVMEQYISVIFAALSGFAFVTLINHLEDDGATMLTEVSILLGLSGFLALNFNYVLILRAAKLTSIVFDSEVFMLLIYRKIVNYSLIFVLYIFYDFSINSIFYFASRFSIEGILNVFRASYKIKLLNRYSIIFYALDILLILLFLVGAIDLSTLSYLWLLLHVISSITSLLIVKINCSAFKLGVVADYFKLAGPLLLSSARELISGHGLIVAASQVLTPNSLLIFFTINKLFKVATILFTSVSNFFIQQITRKQFDKYLFVAITMLSISVMVFIYFLLDVLLSFWGLENRFDFYETLGLFITPILVSGYSVVQYYLMAKREIRDVYLLESFIIFVCLFCFYLAPYSFVIYFMGIAHLVSVGIFLFLKRQRRTK